MLSSAKKQTRGEFREAHPALTTPEPQAAPVMHGRVALVLDGTRDAVKDQTLICALARLVDFARVKKKIFFIQLRPTTLGRLSRFCRMRSETVRDTLFRLQDQHRIYLRQPPQRRYGSRVVIQVGVGAGGVLCAPVLSPEFLFNETSRNLFHITRNGASKDKIHQVLKRAEEHLLRIQNQEEQARLKELLKTFKKNCVQSEPPQESNENLLKRVS